MSAINVHGPLHFPLCLCLLSMSTGHYISHFACLLSMSTGHYISHFAYVCYQFPRATTFPTLPMSAINVHGPLHFPLCLCLRSMSTGHYISHFACVCYQCPRATRFPKAWDRSCIPRCPTVPPAAHEPARKVKETRLVKCGSCRL